MELELSINGVIKSLEVAPNESLLTMLRREGYFSVKHGCESGECGACTVLVDGLARPACVTLAAHAGGSTLTTVEGLGTSQQYDALQEAFIDSGAIQCGFCTPGMLLSASALLKNNPSPGEEEVRSALSGNLCRCTGYAKPVQAVLRAAAVLRGEKVTPLSEPPDEEGSHDALGDQAGNAPAPARTQAPGEYRVVGKSMRKIDAARLVKGKATFTDDIDMRGMLTARLLTSPHAHALIRNIDVSEAQALPGVSAVLTYKDLPRVPYTSSGQSWPESGPHDQYILDNRVRFVGDRVAIVAAETAEIAEQALKLIQVDYEVLPAVLDPRLSMSPQAPKIHAEQESYQIYDPDQNIAAFVQSEVGNVERGFSQADLIVEGEYVLPQVQHVPLENHVAITYWDESERLIVRSNTLAPYELRRTLATILGIPQRRIKVITANIGGGVGVKQELLVEDLCACLTLATNRPVRLEYTRSEEFRSSRTRHAQIIRMKTGVRRDGTIIANSMQLLANTGAYGSHARTVQSNTGAGTLSLYSCPNMRFEAQVVYTNLPPAGAFPGYGAAQGFFALESHLDEIARQLGIDALELRRKNWVKTGDTLPLLQKLNESPAQTIQSSGLSECLRTVEQRLHWHEKRGKGGQGRQRHGVGVALAMSTPALSGSAMASASLKLNEDGSFYLLVGGSDSGSGATTLFAQIAAEILGVSVADILPGSPDTDITPAATGVYSPVALSLCSQAVSKAAQQVREQILTVASRLLKVPAAQLHIADRTISGAGDQQVRVAQVAMQALYIERQQISASASASEYAPPAFAAQGVEVNVDTETGVVNVVNVVSAVDVGYAINPRLLEAQIEGGVALALGSALTEEMLYDNRGNLLTTNLNDYRIFNAQDMPVLETHLIQSASSAGFSGGRSVEDLASSALSAAVANAVTDALGMRLRQIPLTPERIIRLLRAQAQNRS